MHGEIRPSIQGAVTLLRQQERIFDTYTVVVLAVVHVLGVDRVAAENPSRSENGRVPIAGLIPLV